MKLERNKERRRAMNKPLWATLCELEMCGNILLGFPMWSKAIIVLCIIIILLPDEIEIWI